MLSMRLRAVRIRMTILALTAVVIASCGPNLATGEMQGVQVDPPVPKPDFTLFDTSGNTYDFAGETEGKLTLLYFGYLNCPDICPVHLAQIAEVFDQKPDLARQTEVVFVSVDPDRDDRQSIRDYLEGFDHRFVGLTGSLAEVQAAQAAAGVPEAVFVGDGTDYTVDHAGWVIAYSPDGLNRATYPFGTRQSDWLNDLPLLKELTDA